MNSVKNYMPRIKICGLKTLDDIEIINENPIDYVGFVFAPSKRQVTIKLAAQMKEKLNKNIKAVGVFVNTPVDKVNEIVKDCGLDIVQLHGDETLKQCIQVKVPVWKSISVKDEKTLEKIQNFCKVGGIVVDSYSPQARGGTGKTFCWEWCKDLYRDYFTILAGGLNSDNILKAIDIVKPHVVDVSSGVESDNKKDKVKINEFIGRVKEYGIK